jgi:hypothetical protein
MVLQLPFASAWAQGTASDDPVRCISLARLDRTEVIDDRSIAFFMRSGDIYVNRLDHVCRNLDKGRPFSYRTAIRQLCSSDTITIIEDFGFGFSPGASCGLGIFSPIAEVDLAILKGDELPAEITVEDIDLESTEIENSEIGNTELEDTELEE